MKIEEVIGSETWAKIPADIQKSISEKIGTRSFVEDDGKMIPKHRLDEVIGEREGLKTQLAERDNQIKAISKDLEKMKPLAQENETVKAEIVKMQETITKTQTEASEKIKSMLVDTKIRESLISKGLPADAIDLLTPKFDRKRIVVSEDNSSVAGIDDQIATLEKTFPTAFSGKPTQVGTGFQPGRSPNLDGVFTRDELSKLTKEQLRDPKVLEKANKSLAAIQKS
jgi:hypothetical protein